MRVRVEEEEDDKSENNVVLHRTLVKQKVRDHQPVISWVTELMGKWLQDYNNKSEQKSI